MQTTRKILTADIWASWRGLGMGAKTIAELEAIKVAHETRPEFASQVIVQAAREAISVKRRAA